eukprot:6054812-Amphidinium_carterae.1
MSDPRPPMGHRHAPQREPTQPLKEEGRAADYTGRLCSATQLLLSHAGASVPPDTALFSGW